MKPSLKVPLFKKLYTLFAGDSVNMSSSLIIQNVTALDLDNYSCVAINRGGMAECTTSLSLLQVLLTFLLFLSSVHLTGEPLVGHTAGADHHHYDTRGGHSLRVQSVDHEDPGHKVGEREAGEGDDCDLPVGSPRHLLPVTWSCVPGQAPVRTPVTRLSYTALCQSPGHSLTTSGHSNSSLSLSDVPGCRPGLGSQFPDLVTGGEAHWTYPCSSDSNEVSESHRQHYSQSLTLRE